MPLLWIYPTLLTISFSEAKLEGWRLFRYARANGQSGVSRCLQALKRAHFACVKFAKSLCVTTRQIGNAAPHEDRMVAHTGYLIFGRSVTQVIEGLFAGTGKCCMTNTLSLPDNLAQHLADLHSAPKGGMNLKTKRHFRRRSPQPCSYRFYSVIMNGICSIRAASMG